MTFASVFSLAVTVTYSFAVGSLLLAASVVFLWIVEFRKEGDSFAEVWRYLGIKFFMLLSAIMSVAVMPFTYSIVHKQKGESIESAAPADKPCSCPCDACQKCQRKNPNNAE